MKPIQARPAAGSSRCELALADDRDILFSAPEGENELCLVFDPIAKKKRTVTLSLAPGTTLERLVVAAPVRSDEQDGEVGVPLLHLKLVEGQRGRRALGELVVRNAAVIASGNLSPGWSRLNLRLEGSSGYFQAKPNEPRLNLVATCRGSGYIVTNGAHEIDVAEGSLMFGGHVDTLNVQNGCTLTIAEVDTTVHDLSMGRETSIATGHWWGNLEREIGHRIESAHQGENANTSTTVWRVIGSGPSSKIVRRFATRPLAVGESIASIGLGRETHLILQSGAEGRGIAADGESIDGRGSGEISAPPKVDLGRFSALRASGPLVVACAQHAELSSANEGEPLEIVATESTAEKPYDGAVLRHVDIAASSKGRATLLALSACQYYQPATTYRQAARISRDDLQAHADFLEARAQLVGQKCPNGFQRSVSEYAAFRGRRLSATSPLERLLLTIYSMVGYGRRPGPAVLLWLVFSSAALFWRTADGISTTSLDDRATVVIATTLPPFALLADDRMVGAVGLLLQLLVTVAFGFVVVVLARIGRINRKID